LGSSFLVLSGTTLVGGPFPEASYLTLRDFSIPHSSSLTSTITLPDASTYPFSIRLFFFAISLIFSISPLVFIVKKNAAAYLLFFT
tara:strand:- start:824 stop:1081 length:258 start_codon:yes stop_codon:yes gene_type:complete